MNIRQAKISDCSGIQTFLHHSWEETYSKLLSKAVILNILKEWHSKKELTRQIKDPSGLFLLVEENGSKILGLITLKIENERELFLGRLYIRKDHQKNGIGKTLLENSLRFFPKHKYLNIEVLEKNTNALDFYLHMGFSPVAKSEMYIIHELIKVIILRKKLF